MAAVPAAIVAFTWRPVPALVFPVAVAALPLLTSSSGTRRLTTLVTACLIFLWCLVALASVGFYFLPSFVTSVLAHRRATVIAKG